MTTKNSPPLDIELDGKDGSGLRNGPFKGRRGATHCGGEPEDDDCCQSAE
jgi:hypothetical protein